MQDINLTWAIIGNPNSGKTAFFNAITGSKKKSTNYPGVTIDINSSTLQLKNKKINLIDLPGHYSFHTQSFDETITRDYILKRPNKFFKNPNLNLNYDGIILVADATQLEKTLYLAMELKHAQLPFMLVLTHWDQAKSRGLVLDLEKWTASWQTKIFTVDNFNQQDILNVIKIWDELNPKDLKSLPEKMSSEKILQELSTPQFIANAFKSIDKDIQNFTLTKLSANNWTERIDKIMLHPILGICLMIIVLILVFQLLFSLAIPIQEFIELCFSSLSELVIANFSPSTFRDLLTEGIIAGVGSVCVFLPQISILSLLITILEDCGYLSRVAFLLDGFMKRLALPGKAVIPLLTSHACAIPAIMSTRNLDNEEDRITTMMITPLTTCSARIPVYTLLIGAMIPTTLMIGPVSAQAMAMFGLYTLAILTSFLVGFILKKKVFKSKAHHLLLQLPSYKMPRMKNIWQNVRMQSVAFLSKAGGVILVLSIIIWALASFPKHDPTSLEPQESYVEKIGHAIQPVLAPLGFDWKLSAALIPSFAAREVMVSALATVNAIEIGDIENEEEIQPLKNMIKQNYDLGTIIALLLWFVFAPQCISTFAILKKESNGYFWPTITFTYSLIIAYGSAFLANLLI
jgi:ferrous iron transport protein B